MPADPAELLHGGPGVPEPVALDLTWETAGIPYAYRLATRLSGKPCIHARR